MYVQYSIEPPHVYFNNLVGDSWKNYECTFFQKHKDLEYKELDSWNSYKNRLSVEWSRFHDEELVRMIAAKLDEKDHRTGILERRFDFCQLGFYKNWTRKKGRVDEGVAKEFVSILAGILGMNRVEYSKWDISTKPCYLDCGHKDWLIINDARTTADICSSLPEDKRKKHLVCYGTGLRLIHRSEVSEDDEVLQFGQQLRADETVEIQQLIGWCLSESKIKNEQDNQVRIYKPLIDIEGSKAFRHNLKGLMRPTYGGQCCLTAGEHELALTLDDKKKLRLGFIFYEDDEENEIISSIWLIVTNGGENDYHELGPASMIDKYSDKDNQPALKTKKDQFNGKLKYYFIRELTKAFRASAAKEMDLVISDEYWGLGLPSTDIWWMKRGQGSKIEKELRSEIYRINWWRD